MRNSEIVDFKKNSQEEKLSEVYIDPNLRLSQPISTHLNILTEEDENVSRETLNSIYGDNYDIIKLKLLDTENEAINYLTDTISVLQVKYKNFNTDINTHFRDLTSKITDAFKLNNNQEENAKNSKKDNKEILIQKYTKDYIEQLQKIINIHQQIFKNIKNTISIFYNFLDISKFIGKEKPINEFFSKEFKNIIENWLFMQIDLENFDFTKAINESSFDTDLKSLLLNTRKNKNFIMNISNPTKYMKICKKNFDKLHPDKARKLSLLYEKNKKIMTENHDNLFKLKMRNVFYIDKYFEPDVVYNKIKFLKFDNVTFANQDEKQKEFLKNMPSLEKLMINSSNNFDISLLKDLSKSLIKLSLTKNGFVDFEFKNIMENYLVKSEHIRKNLQYLSFSDNYLSNINLNQIVYLPKHSFLSLKELDFKNNKIFQFMIDPNYFPDLKCINCCYNYLTKNNFEQYEEILTLLSGNIFLSQKQSAENYFTNLSRKLNTYTITLTYLNLSYIPKEISNNYLNNIIINDSILINLRKLDLSYNNLVCDTIINFFNNNKSCFCLKSLNLSNNLLDASFFEKYLEAGLNKQISKLKYIKLDSNKFGSFDDIDESPEKQNEEYIKLIRSLYKFIYENKNLVDLTITKNDLCNNLIVMNIEENANNFNFNDYVVRDKNGKIEIRCFYSFLWKIRIEMNEENKKDKSEIRPLFNIKFDCRNSINKNSDDFEFNTDYIIFANQVQ
jgi:hypothetical protein